MDAIKKTMDKHAPLKSKTKTKKTTIPGSTRIHKGSKLNEGWLKKRWIKSKHKDLLEYKHINSIYKKHLHHAKKTHIYQAN